MNRKENNIIKKIITIAQTPPPFHGQSIMQEYLVNANWNWCIKKNIRLDFSDSVKDVGEFQIKKIIKLFRIIARVMVERIKGQIDILFYPPTGPHRIPFYRDAVILLFARCFAKKIIFQFHAGDFNGLLRKLNKFELKLAKYIYRNPDAAIVLLPSLKKEVEWINPFNTYVIPNGIEDVNNKSKMKLDKGYCKILFVGLLSERKGIFICLEMLKILKAKNYFVKFTFVGGWASASVENEAKEFIRINELTSYIEFVGVKSGDDKWSCFVDSDIFCMPTYETEAMPITIIEAMMMGLPVVTTNWRSIPDIVDENVTGYLVQIKDSIALADRIMYLIDNKAKREEMGKKGREKFLMRYTLEKHLVAMEEVFKNV